MGVSDQDSLLAFREEMRSGLNNVNTSIGKTQEHHQALLVELTALRTEFTAVKDDVAELKQSVGGLINLKHQGIGIVMAVGLLASLAFLGIKYWLANFVDAIRGA